MQKQYTVQAFWDDEAEMWVAEGIDIPGLCTEANNMEALIKKLKVMVPEMLEANGVAMGDNNNVPFDLVSHIHHQQPHSIN